jgi:hypothetical protein
VTATSADLGRAFVTTNAAGQLIVSQTTISTDANGRPPAVYGSGLTGRVLSRGNLVSKVTANGGITGVVMAQGDLGVFSTLLSTTAPTRVGGVATDSSSTTGSIVALGRIVGDINLLGGLNGSGRVAAAGSILGNVTINRMGVGTAVVSGGTIGDAALGTSISFTSNQGIIAAVGAVRNRFNTPTAPGYFVENAGTAADPNDATVLRSLYLAPDGSKVVGLDAVVAGDLGGVLTVLSNLNRLKVVSNKLSL